MKAFMLTFAFLALCSWSYAEDCPMHGHSMSAQAKEGGSCPADCPEKGHDVLKSTDGVTLTGMIKCNHCDLHRTDKCQKVLVTEDKKVYQFCPMTVKDVDWKTLSEKQVRVTGTLKEMKDTDSVIHVDKIQPVS